MVEAGIQSGSKRARGSRRSVTLGRALAVLSLAAAFAAQPLGQTLHVAFASHDHRHCPIHHVMEDVPLGTTATAAPVDDLPGLLAVSTARDHVPCPILNAHGAPASPSLRSHGAGAVASRLAATLPPDPPAARRSTRILLAPKNSPPATQDPA
jgi:hypothetical protein